MIILNEKNFAESVLYDKDLGSKPSLSLAILSRYYYHCKGYKRKKIIELLTEFMEKYYKRYLINKQNWDCYIEKIAKSARKYHLYEIEEIEVTDREMTVIKSISNKVLQRLAFTSLCIAKYGNIKNANNNSWVNINEKELFDLANISCGAKDRSKKIGQLGTLGLVEFPKKNDNMHFRITFEQEGKRELVVKDFRNLGYQFRKYCGENNFTKCAQCEKLIKNNKNGTRKYCDECAGYVPQKYKTIKCTDCGMEFEINSLNHKSKRCKECQRKKQLEYQRTSMQKLRNVK